MNTINNNKMMSHKWSGFFVDAVVENSGVIFLEETQPRKRKSLCTERVNNGQ